MKRAPTYIAEFEELVLLATLKLGKNAYGAAIHEALEEAGRRTSIGALYTTLSRLEAKGFLSSRMGESTFERGGRAKKYFKVQSSGEHALREARVAREKLTPEYSYLVGGVA